ncbi:serine/threonine protein kinase [Psychrobacillus sp. FSL H8-0510]|uniref:serine/threonine protein kinase n=1 Tax=Psychrobacillus sp. FSL H8-0510 TaxID=2921394 RepID=UPI0030F649C0
MSNYEEVYNEEKREQLILWKQMANNLFPIKVNETVRITDSSQIIQILNTIGKSKALNHTFVPSGGGSDLSSALYSNESGLIELTFGTSREILNLESLTFHPIGENPEWWYFRLNALPFHDSGVYETQEIEKDKPFSSLTEIERNMKYSGEDVLEVAPGVYKDYSFYERGYIGHNINGDEIPLPKHASVVTRRTNGGDFVIFAKYSKYNQSSGTYAGQHSWVSGEQFEKLIKEIVEELSSRSLSE